MQHLSCALSMKWTYETNEFSNSFLIWFLFTFLFLFISSCILYSIYLTWLCFRYKRLTSSMLLLRCSCFFLLHNSFLHWAPVTVAYRLMFSYIVLSQTFSVKVIPLYQRRLKIIWVTIFLILSRIYNYYQSRFIR